VRFSSVRAGSSNTAGCKSCARIRHFANKARYCAVPNTVCAVSSIALATLPFGTSTANAGTDSCFARLQPGLAPVTLNRPVDLEAS
jgi:hypothetical protein